MQQYSALRFPADGPWRGPDIATIAGAAVKLRWTDQPYRWHANTGQEVFMVVDGIVDMHVRQDGVERIIPLHAGDLLHINVGEEHVAHPRGPARILVIEEVDSE